MPAWCDAWQGAARPAAGAAATRAARGRLAARLPVPGRRRSERGGVRSSSRRAGHAGAKPGAVGRRCAAAASVAGAAAALSGWSASLCSGRRQGWPGHILWPAFPTRIPGWSFISTAADTAPSATSRVVASRRPAAAGRTAWRRVALRAGMVRATLAVAGGRNRTGTLWSLLRESLRQGHRGPIRLLHVCRQGIT